MASPQFTSAERRGIAAVAAAALICLGSGLLARRCSAITQPAPTQPPQPVILSSDSISEHMPTDPAGIITTPDDTLTLQHTDKPTKSKRGKNAGRIRKTSSPAPSPPPRDPLEDLIPIE